MAGYVLPVAEPETAAEVLAKAFHETAVTG